MSTLLSKAIDEVNPQLNDSPYLKDMETNLIGWRSAFQAFNINGFNFPLVEKAVEDAKKTPETTLSNGSKIKNYINSISTQSTSIKFPVITRELKFKKVAGTSYYSYKSSDLPEFRAECFPTAINVPHKKRVVDVKYLAFDTVITHLKYCPHDTEHIEATKDETGYRSVNDDLPFNVVGVSIADHQFYNSYMKWEVRFELEEESEDTEIDSFWIFQVAPANFAIVGRVLTGVAPDNEISKAIKEDLKKVREGENIHQAGMTIKGTFHVPITFKRDGKKLTYTPDRSYRACAGVFIQSKSRPKNTKVLDSITPAYIMSRRFHSLTSVQFGIGLNLTTAHANALFNVTPEVVFEIEYEDEAHVPESLDGFLIQARLMNINKLGVVELH